MAETKLDSIYAPLVYFIETCCVLVVFGLGAWDVAGGRLRVAGLLAFAACLAYGWRPVRPHRRGSLHAGPAGEGEPVALGSPGC